MFLKQNWAHCEIKREIDEKIFLKYEKKTSEFKLNFIEKLVKEQLLLLRMNYFWSFDYKFTWFRLEKLTTRQKKIRDEAMILIKENIN